VCLFLSQRQVVASFFGDSDLCFNHVEQIEECIKGIIDFMGQRRSNSALLLCARIVFFSFTAILGGTR